jgi:hypothetical protein
MQLIPLIKTLRSIAAYIEWKRIQKMDNSTGNTGGIRIGAG